MEHMTISNNSDIEKCKNPMELSLWSVPNDLFICTNSIWNLINLGEKENQWKIAIHVITFQIHEQLII
jgi:hypothetical protein